MLHNCHDKFSLDIDRVISYEKVLGSELWKDDFRTMLDLVKDNI